MEFTRFFEDIVPIEIRRDTLTSEESISCEIRTHLGTWVGGKLTRLSDDPKAWLDTDEDLCPGTSGGPIVDENGQIIAIVSNFGDSSSKDNGGFHSLPLLWLPSWLLAAVAGGE